MAHSLMQKSITALKQGNLSEKVVVYCANRLKGITKNVRRKYCRFDGNWYHGKTAKDYEITRVRQDWWHDESRVLSKFLKLIPKGAAVLDVPIGTARFLPLYHENQMSVSGLDISHDMLSEARSLRGELLDKCQIDIGDARDVPYADNSFDVIVSFRFLDGHVTFGDLKKVITEFCRVSRKYLILELGALPVAGSSECALDDLAEDRPIGGRLSGEERVNLLRTFGLRVTASESAYENGKPFMTVYLCEIE